MTDISRGIVAIIALCSAVLIGQIAGRIARTSFARDDRPGEVAEFAGAIGRVMRWSAYAIGALIAVAALDPDSFGRLPDRALTLVPSSVMAAVVAAGGYALAIAATATVAATAVRSAGRRHLMLERLVRFGILAVTATVALSLLGVDSAILGVALGLLAGVPLITAAALTALGGRDVARSLAAGRVVRSHLRVGHRLRVGALQGVITAVHPVSVEIETDDSEMVQIPLRLLLDEPFAVNPTLARSPQTP